MKAQYRPEDKLQYYSYILCYANDILCIHDPDDVLNKLNGYMCNWNQCQPIPICIWDDWDRTNWYSYHSIPIIITLSNAKTGHLEEALHITGYLKLRHNSRLRLNPSYPNIDHSNIWECDWTDFYESAVEAIPPNALLSRGKEVDLHMFRESDHIDDKWTRRSRTGFMIYMNLSLINGYSKNQSTIKTSVFGTKFVAC